MISLYLVELDNVINNLYVTLSDEWLFDPRFLVGSVIFFFGMAVNIHSDNILMNLREPGETGYKIPRGGMFEYVSSANYGAMKIVFFSFQILRVVVI